MNVTTENLTEQTLDAIHLLEEGVWGPIAQLILTVDKGNLWRYRFANFSEWMQSLNDQFQISRSRCWRYKKAGSYYESLRTEDEKLCELEELPTYVSAEALEILERLERVAPKNIIQNIKQQVLKGQISIRTLKQTWAAYRPALDGATHRGRGMTGFPDVVRNSIQFEAESILALNRNPIWTRSKSPARCVVLPNVEDKTQRQIYDALALVQQSLDSPVEIHIFELLYRTGPTEQLNAPEPYTDFCWLVLPESYASSFTIPPKNNFGVIGLSDEQITIHHQAQKIIHQAGETDPFMRELLKLALRN